MVWFRSRDFLTRRIDRCYLVAAATKAPQKRQMHLAMARHYRAVLSAAHEGTFVSQPV
jgi:hypothetical protein